MTSSAVMCAAEQRNVRFSSITRLKHAFFSLHKWKKIEKID
jgi:hypothetical protein